MQFCFLKIVRDETIILTAHISMVVDSHRINQKFSTEHTPTFHTRNVGLTQYALIYAVLSTYIVKS